MNTEANPIDDPRPRGSVALTTPAGPPPPVPGAASASVRIVLAADCRFVRELTHEFLSHQPGLAVVAEVSAAREAADVCQRLSPNLLILDFDLSWKSEVGMLSKFKRLCPETPILVCAGSMTEEGIAATLRSGIDGFMEKTHGRADFLKAVAQVARGKNYFCAHSSRILSEIARGLHVQTHDPSGLTAREKEVLALIAVGRTSKEIATQLHIAVGTVDTHRTNLMRKLGVRNAAGLTRSAIARGLV